MGESRLDKLSKEQTRLLDKRASWPRLTVAKALAMAYRAGYRKAREEALDECRHMNDDCAALIHYMKERIRLLGQ